MVPDLAATEIQCFVAPSIAAVWNATQLRIMPPEFAVDITLFIIDIMNVVHTSGQPGRKSQFARPGNPAGIDIDAVLSESPGRMDPASGPFTRLRFQTGQQRLIVRAFRIIAPPDRVPNLAGKTGTHGVDAKNQFMNLGVGILVHPAVHHNCVQLFTGTSEEKMTIILVESDTALDVLDRFGSGCSCKYGRIR